MTPKMSEMNKRLEDMIRQIREMKLTPDELDDVIKRYEGHENATLVLIHTAATMLRLEVEFGGRS